VTTSHDQTPPADVDELRDEIEQTRAELGETVEALAAKADVKARLKETAEEKKEQLRDGAAETAAKIQQGAAEAKTRLRGKASEVGVLLKDSARETASASGALAERAQDKAVQVREDVRRRPVPYGAVAAGAAALVVAVLVWRRRSR